MTDGESSRSNLIGLDRSRHSPPGPAARPVTTGHAPAMDEMAVGFCAAGTGIVVADAQWRVLAVNSAYARRSGCAAGELVGQLLTAEVPRDLASGTENEVLLHDRSGQAWPALVRVETLADEHGQAQRHVVTFTDISALKREQAALRHQAQHDTLTGLSNRSRFEDELARSLARMRRLGHTAALLFIDLDGFKHVNDTLGHAVGDRLLAEVGRRLRTTLRAEDLVSRLGGDEFAVLLENTVSAAAAAQVAATLLAALARRGRIDCHVLSVSASIGIACYPEHGIEPGDLLRMADAAMYRAKQRGGGRFALAG